MRVLFVTSEIYPLVKTGGLGDVSAALPPALREAGVDAQVLLPGYPGVMAGVQGLVPVRRLSRLPGGCSGQLLRGMLPDGVPAWVIDVPVLYDRPGNPYLDPLGRDWADNHVRFAVLGWVAAEMAHPTGGGDWIPDILHGHDWQSGLMPAYLGLQGGRQAATVMTIHNIAYQGQFPPDRMGELLLPPECYSIHGVEYYGSIGFLKAGLYYADHLTTVSPSYAREVQSSEHGCGLDGLLALRTEEFDGILNGVDYGIWNPATDPHIAARYDADSFDAKPLNKQALQEEFGLEVRSDIPLFAMVSRLNWHKGADLLLAALPELFRRGGQVVVLGSGDRALEDAFRTLAHHWPRAAGVRIGYDEALAHRIQAGSDVFLVPSRAEPCGLTQLYALRYGTLPLVRRTGGLEDTVIDVTPAALADGCATGFVFGDATLSEISWAIRRALETWRQPHRWRTMQRHAMTRDFGWGRSAVAYRELYERIKPRLTTSIG